ncbi:MAG: copper-binding protein [Burkholderiales bacterium]
MKRFVIASLTGAALAAGAGVFGAPPASVSNFALGVVQNVDRSASAVSVAHEPVVALNWPAMTMQFKVGDAALFDRLQPGGRIAFEFVGEDGGYRVVSAIPLAQAVAPSARGSHEGMHGGVMGGDMSGMQEMCMGMMGQMGGGKPSRQFWR